MTDLRDAARQALETLEQLVIGTEYEEAVATEKIITALKAALEQPEQEPHWLTKELMADYLDMIAEAISENSTEMLRHKAWWMRMRGEV